MPVRALRECPVYRSFVRLLIPPRGNGCSCNSFALNRWSAKLFFVLFFFFFAFLPLYYYFFFFFPGRCGTGNTLPFVWLEISGARGAEPELGGLRGGHFLFFVSQPCLFPFPLSSLTAFETLEPEKFLPSRAETFPAGTLGAAREMELLIIFNYF